jgi:hypothetical protein
MPLPIDTDLDGASETWSHPTRAEQSPVLLPAVAGIRLSDILNLRVGCWRPAVYVRPLRRADA